VKALSGKAFCRLLERYGWQLLRVQAVVNDTTFFSADECWCTGEVLTADGAYTKQKPIFGPCPGRREPARCIGAPVFAFPQVIA
jgi:hypothetical protein